MLNTLVRQQKLKNLLTLTRPTLIIFWADPNIFFGGLCKENCLSFLHWRLNRKFSMNCLLRFTRHSLLTASCIHQAFWIFLRAHGMNKSVIFKDVGERGSELKKKIRPTYPIFFSHASLNNIFNDFCLIDLYYCGMIRHSLFIILLKLADYLWLCLFFT